MPCCLAAGRPPLSIDISCSHGAQQQTRCTQQLRSNDGTDRQTVDCFVDPAPHTMRAVSIIGQAEGTTAGRLVNASPWALAGRRNSDLYHCRVWTWTLRIHSLIHSNRLLKTSSQDSRWFLPEFLVSISFQLLVLKGFMLIFSTRMAAD